MKFELDKNKLGRTTSLIYAELIDTNIKGEVEIILKFNCKDSILIDKDFCNTGHACGISDKLHTIITRSDTIVDKSINSNIILYNKIIAAQKDKIKELEDIISKFGRPATG